ncbi:MAG: amidase [Bacteroidales bacterium]|nr:amidase [Bacteroidales bacterium]
MTQLFSDNTIAEIHKMLIEKKISTRDILDTLFNNYDVYQNKYFPWVSFDKTFIQKQYEEVQKRIDKDSELRLLEGIPVGIKDIYNTIDFPTQMGSPLWKDFTPGNDARAVFNIKRAGGIIPGKTVTAEFAVHALNETLNPHDISKTPGTSSSGSAVAIATGTVPVSLGTQTAGSIIRPASYCGIYACKPSFGLIPRTGMLKTTDSLDTIGFFSIFYEDLQRVFEALRVHGPNYPISYREFKEPDRIDKPAKRPWKVAFCKTHTWEFAEDYAKSSINKFVNDLSNISDVKIEELIPPDEFSGIHEIHATIYNKTLSYYFAEEFKKSELVSPVMNELIVKGNNISNQQYLDALEEQLVLCRKMDDILKNYDVMISLSTAGEAPGRNISEKPDPALMWTLLHLPVVNVPKFISPDQLPFGLQIISRRYNDLKMFRFTDFLLKNNLIPKKNYPVLDF